MDKHLNLETLRYSTVAAPTGEPDDADLKAIAKVAGRKLAADEVYVRSCFIASDQLCESDLKRLTPKALKQIAKGIIGRSVTRGHSRDELPIGRFFSATVTERDGYDNELTGKPTQWVKTRFYWPAGTPEGEQIKRNIDTGVYRDVSLMWTSTDYRCSVCSKSLFDCDHMPGQEYDGKRCYGIIDDVKSVLAGGIVFKGADANAEIAERSERGTEPTQEGSEDTADDKGLSTRRCWAALELERQRLATWRSQNADDRKTV